MDIEPTYFWEIHVLAFQKEIFSECFLNYSSDYVWSASPKKMMQFSLEKVNTNILIMNILCANAFIIAINKGIKKPCFVIHLYCFNLFLSGNFHQMSSEVWSVDQTNEEGTEGPQDNHGISLKQFIAWLLYFTQFI